MMIGIGMKASFVPAFVPGELWQKTLNPSEIVTGKIVYINWEHKYFTVEFKCGDTTQREAFKFFQIGTAVKIIG